VALALLHDIVAGCALMNDDEDAMGVRPVQLRQLVIYAIIWFALLQGLNLLFAIYAVKFGLSSPFRYVGF
jgi:hypothetical protein